MLLLYKLNLKEENRQLNSNQNRELTFKILLTISRFLVIGPIYQSRTKTVICTF